MIQKHAYSHVLTTQRSVEAATKSCQIPFVWMSFCGFPGQQHCAAACLMSHVSFILTGNLLFYHGKGAGVISPADIVTRGAEKATY